MSKMDTKELAESVGADRIFFRNPSHVFEGKNAETQTDIVKAIKGVGKKVHKEILTYGEDNKTPILPGFKKVKEMTKDELTGLCKSLMRYKPNIYKVHIVLGDYPDLKRSQERVISELHFDKPQDATFIAERLATILAGGAVNLRFEITNAAAGRFGTECEAFTVTAAVYDKEDDPHFDPKVLIEYFPN